MKLDRVIAVRNNKTVYRDGDKCIKVFNAEYSKSNVLNEALNQSRIEETGLRIPKVLEVTMIEGKWAIVSEYIKGKTLAQLIKEEPEKKNAYIELLVDLQLEIHQKPSPLLNKLSDKTDRKIAESDLDATTRYDLHIRLESMPKQKKICHGDFTPSNVVITEDGTPYILDWSHATQGNTAADAACSYLLLCLHGDSESAQYYLETFCKKSGTELSTVQKWIPIVAAAQSVTAGSEEREQLLCLGNLVHYR